MTTPDDSDFDSDPALDPVDTCPVGELAIPRGQLVHARVVGDLEPVLRRALDRALTGYAAVADGDRLLVEGRTDPAGVVGFIDGVPLVAYHAGRDLGGSAALTALDATPCRVEAYVCPAAPLRAAAVDALRVAPGAPAERLAAAPDLAARTRRRAADRPSIPTGDAVGDADAGTDRITDRPPDPSSPTATGTEVGREGDARADALTAFLDDDDRIDAIRTQARETATRHAAEWDLEDQLADDA